MPITGRPPKKKRVQRAGVETEYESKAKKRLRQSGKTSIGVLIDADVWKAFRMHCLQYDESPGSLLTEVIKDFLNKQGS